MKRQLSIEEKERLRRSLQAATLAALMGSRRWQPGEIAFQGGTCLHLMHGSARFSEDLDFMVRVGLSMKNINKEIERRLQDLPGVPRDMAVTVKEFRDGKNPRSIMVTLGSEGVIGFVKVKVELWETPTAALNAIETKVSSMQTPTFHTAYVPTLTLQEILGDKVYALGARDRLKARDVFDLWWLYQHGISEVDAHVLMLRLEVYPRGETKEATALRWIQSAGERLPLLTQPSTCVMVEKDLRRWLPSSWPLDSDVATEMLEVSARALRHGLSVMEEQFGQQDPERSIWSERRG